MMHVAVNVMCLVGALPRHRTDVRIQRDHKIQYIEWLILNDRVQPSLIAGVVPVHRVRSYREGCLTVYTPLPARCAVHIYDISQYQTEMSQSQTEMSQSQTDNSHSYYQLLLVSSY